MASENEYRLLDSGDGRRLERFGPHILIRPAAQAYWSPSLPQTDWDRATGEYLRSSRGGGDWKMSGQVPASWPIELSGVKTYVKPTGFGHVGIFPEQQDNWSYIDRCIRRATSQGEAFEVMNLFAYTGMATLVSALAGASVCHLDASRAVVDWAKDNAVLSGLRDRPIRWIVEDVMKFIGREQRRGHRYHGLVLDPPTFGRGNKGEVWKIEDGLSELLSASRKLLDEKASFVTLSTYSPKFTPLVLANVMQDVFAKDGGKIDAWEMTICEEGGRKMPNGVTARWSRPEER